ncbi:MAG: pirin family protein [Alphaproteobacteria bacterium]|nr:pirin family protein [Alphaproteobacteria bacterium]
MDRETSAPTPLPDAVTTVVVPRPRDLGDGFMVERVLPAAQQRAVGSFVFFDRMGPVTFGSGRGLDVRPHPHIGLATVTYLFEGEILHRDSLGTVQPIRPGAVNWMTAGSGIVHSERTPAALRTGDSRLAGIQLWVALPRALEEAAPDFAHYPAEAIPQILEDGATVRLILGALRGTVSPVRTSSSLLYADCALAAGGRLAIPADQPERAIYVLSGTVEAAGARFDAGRLIAFAAGREIDVRAAEPARILLLGGEPLDAPRHMWWNFVSSSKERIEGAKADWQSGRFTPVPGESEFIPLPR